MTETGRLLLWVHARRHSTLQIFDERLAQTSDSMATAAE
jgi:hypothetical protein